MPSAYTPGLQISDSTLVRKTRRLPLKGEVTVAVGDEVQPETVVARSRIPGLLRTVRASERLGIDPDELHKLLAVQQGDEVTSGQLLGSNRSFFGWFKSECHSPVDGVVEIVNPVTGHVSIRERPRPVEVSAYVHGKVVERIEGEGVVVETRAALVQGIFGVGGERRAPLRTAVSGPAVPLTADCVTPEMAGQILVGGSHLTEEALHRAAELGLAGIVVGAMIDQDLVRFLGYDIGVAITGHEAIPLTLILTEGFGTLAMADRTFRLLRSLEGRVASINGATQIRAGVIRPEVIVPHGSDSSRPAEETDPGTFDLVEGAPIRIIREPYFGELATVSALPPELQEIPTGAHVRVLRARLAGGEEVTVPRANVEILAG